jgi:ProP effector
MTTTDSKKETTNKRITKTDLNQLAQSRYGEDVYCEHVRSGKRGWYLHQGTSKNFIGVNANEAFQYLQTQEQVMPVSDASATVATPTDSPKTSEETVVTPAPVIEAAPVMPEVPVTEDTESSAPSEPVTPETEGTPEASAPSEQAPVTQETKSTPEVSAPSEQTPVTPEAKGTPETSAPSEPVRQEAEGTKIDEAVEQKAPLSPEELLELLFEKFPQTFFREPEKTRPIQKYIHKKIRKALNNEYTKGEISEALILYTQTIDYCKQLMKGGVRIDLQGKPCGEVSVEHQEDAKARFAGETDMRFQKQHRPKIQRLPLPPPQLDELVTGKMEVCLKIHELPADSKTTRNGWEEFLIETERHAVKTTVRPKTWKKLQNAGKEYSHWIANIRGQMGPRSKKGFELLAPAIQIFETKPKEKNPEENPEDAATEPSSTESE